MDRETTRKLTARSPKDPDAAQNCWETPPAIFDKLSLDFGPFDLDMMADETNHLLPQWVGPGSPLGQDILGVLTFVNIDGCEMTANSGYANPIYDYKFINELIPLCALAARKKGFSSTLLLPLRTTSAWWNFLITNQHNEEGAAVIAFCDKRITFYEHGAPRWNAKALAKGKYRPDSAVFDSVVVHFSAAPPAGLDKSTNFDLWDVPPHVPKIHREVL